MDLTDASNAANALQALWCGVVANRRGQQEDEAALRGVAVQNPVRTSAAVREARACSFDTYSISTKALLRRRIHGSHPRAQRRELLLLLLRRAATLP